MAAGTDTSSTLAPGRRQRLGRLRRARAVDVGRDAVDAARATIPTRSPSTPRLERADAASGAGSAIDVESQRVVAAR